jgi:hypothetical protein
MAFGSRNTTYLLVGIIAVLLVTIIGLQVKLSHRNATAPDNTLAANALAEEPTPQVATENQAPPVEAVNVEAAPAAADGPNLDTVEDDIVAIARKWHPDWAFQVDGHRRDWKQITLYAGPKAGQWQNMVHYEWRGGKFVRTGMEPMPKQEAKAASKEAQDGPLTEKDLAGIPAEMRPSESVVREAALMDNPGWAAKIAEHSSDWARATVWIGPSGSEYSTAIKLKWDRSKQCYDVVSKDPLPGE